MELDILAAWQSTTRDLTNPTTSISQLSAAWTTASAFLDPRTPWPVEPGAKFQPPAKLNEAYKVLQAAGMLDELLDDYLQSLRKAFDLVEADVHAHLGRFEVCFFLLMHPPISPQTNPLAHLRQDSSAEDRFEVMMSLLHTIGSWIQRWQQPVALFWPNGGALSSYRKTFLAALYFILPPRFAPALQIYLRTLLSYSPATSASSPAYPLAFPTLITLLDRYDPLLFGLIYEEIEAKVERDCGGQYREKKLEGLLKWLNGAGDGGGVMGWVSGIYEGNLEGGNDEAKKFLKPTFSRFEYHVHKVLCQLRTSELFDIVLDYPQSQPALEDLKVCLVKTDQRHLLVSRLREQLDVRLLHPGTDTKYIIKTYISTIRCLRIVDPPGVLLSRVADPIWRYLRARKDTIRCIVSSLIEEGNPLFEELTSSDAKLLSDSRDEAENYTDQKWMPDPADAPSDFRKSKGADVIQLLVSIYDTKEVFVKELQVLLAQRLLAIRDYSFHKEIKNVETLKLRFGEQSLQGCDVMLKDLQDSRRIDQTVHDQAPALPLHATVVSRLFWPSFQAVPLKLPGQIGRYAVPLPCPRGTFDNQPLSTSAQAAYDRAFTSLKPDKKLRWLPHLGNVNLTIDLKDRSITVDATPVQAAILELFDKQDTWTSDALQTELKLAELSTVRNGLFFWNNLGVIRSLPDDMWRLVEERGKAGEEEGVGGVAHVIEEEKEAVQSVEDQRVEQMRVFWQFIQGMVRRPLAFFLPFRTVTDLSPYPLALQLTNLGALPITRIHSTLNMLAPGYKGKTPDELKALLEAVAVEGLVQKTANGSWKIIK
ncbi:SPOSA6832_02277, partial [Sporobolomyces salmonicolor]